MRNNTNLTNLNLLEFLDILSYLLEISNCPDTHSTNSWIALNIPSNPDLLLKNNIHIGDFSFFSPPFTRGFVLDFLTYQKLTVFLSHHLEILCESFSRNKINLIYLVPSILSYPASSILSYPDPPIRIFPQVSFTHWRRLVILFPIGRKFLIALFIHRRLLENIMSPFPIPLANLGLINVLPNLLFTCLTTCLVSRKIHASYKLVNTTCTVIRKDSIFFSFPPV